MYYIPFIKIKKGPKCLRPFQNHFTLWQGERLWSLAFGAIGMICFALALTRKMLKLHSLLKNHRRTKSFADLYLQTDFCKSRIFKESLLWSGVQVQRTFHFALINIFRAPWMAIFRYFLQPLAQAKPSHIRCLPAPKPWWFWCSFLAPQHLPSAQTLASTQSTKLQPLLLRLQQSNVSHVKGQIGRAVAGNLHERCYHATCHCVQASLEFFVFRTSPTKVHTLWQAVPVEFFTTCARTAAWHRGSSSSISFVTEIPFHVWFKDIRWSAGTSTKIWFMHIPIRLNRKLHAGLISQHNQHCHHCVTTNSDSSEQTCSQDCSPKAQAVAICFRIHAWILTCNGLKARVACRAGNTHAYKGMSSSRNPGTWKWLHKMLWKLF